MERIPAVRRVERDDLRLRIGAQLVLERPRAAGVVLQPGAAQGGVIGVVVYVEFDLSLAPPIALQGSKGYVGAKILSAPLDAVQDYVVLSKREVAV